MKSCVKSCVWAKVVSKVVFELGRTKKHRFQTQLFSPESTNFFLRFGVGVDKSCVSCPNRHIGLYRPAPPGSAQLRVIDAAVLLASLVDNLRDFSVCAWVCFGVFLEARSSLSPLT